MGESRAAEILGNLYNSSALPVFPAKDREQLKICARSHPFEWCMTCTVNKAENVGIQDMMAFLPPNFQLPEGKKRLSEEADVGMESF